MRLLSLPSTKEQKTDRELHRVLHCTRRLTDRRCEVCREINKHKNK